MEDFGSNTTPAPEQLVEVNGHLLPKSHGKFVSNWTQDQIDFLTLKWNEGQISAKQIGCEIGKSKNAVIGKAHRLKLVIRTHNSRRWERPPPQRRLINPLRERKPSERKKKDVVVQRKIPTAPRFYPPEVPLEKSEPIPIGKLSARTCRAIVGKGTDGLAMYCGDMTFWDDRVQRFKSFCAAHAAIYYQQVRRRA
jgi:hypothetical protein